MTFLASLVLALVVTSACTVTPPTATQPPSPTGPPTSSPTSTPAAFDGTDLDGTIDAFAQAGIEVRVRPADAPLVAVAQPARLGLLRFQARNLALEVTAGGGTTGAELDAFTTAAGGEPLGALAAGWLALAATPASRAAAALTAAPAATPPDSADPTAAVFPSAVLLMFIADLLGPAPASSNVSGHLANAGGPLASVGSLTAQTSTEFCAEVSTYLSAVLAGALDPQVELNPSWLANVIDQLALVEPDPEQLRTAVGALALLTYATSVSRPWAANLSAAPGEAHYKVAGDNAVEATTAFYLNVNAGEAAIAEEAAECAALADADLAGGAPGDDKPIHVQWVTVELAPHASSLEGDMELELQPGAQVMSAVLEYETREETEEAHTRGTARSATVTVTAIVQRLEITELQNVVRSLLAGDMGAAQPIVAAELTRLDRPLLDLLYPRGVARVTVTWHDPPGSPPPSPTPTPDPKKEFCDRYVALLRWLVSHMDTDFELTRPWAAEIATRAQDMWPYAPPDLLDYVDLLFRVYNTYATAPDPIQVPIVGPDAARLVEAAVAMDAYCGIVRGQPPYEDIP